MRVPDRLLAYILELQKYITLQAIVSYREALDCYHIATQIHFNAHSLHFKGRMFSDEIVKPT